MEVAIVTVGDELLAGDTENTNAAWLARQLTERGVRVARVLTVPDDRGAIADAVVRYREAFDAVLVTGGLGGTHDDVTVDAVADALGRGLVVDEAARERVVETAAAYRDANPEVVDRYDLAFDPDAWARRPEGARTIPNDAGLAPGFAVGGADGEQGGGAGTDGHGAGTDGDGERGDCAGTDRDGAGSDGDGAGTDGDGAEIDRDGAETDRDGDGIGGDGDGIEADGEGIGGDGDGTVYVLPGPPEELRAVFERVAGEFGGDLVSETLHTPAPESALVPHLEAAREAFDVVVGSYPARGEVHNRIKVSGADPEAVERAVAWVRDRVDAVDSEPP